MIECVSDGLDDSCRKLIEANKGGGFGSGDPPDIGNSSLEIRCAWVRKKQ